MLTLTRAVGESIVLSIDGTTIATMQLVSIRGREAKVSFDAPGVKILRGELRDVEKEGQHQGVGEGSTRVTSDIQGNGCVEDRRGDRQYGGPGGERALRDQPGDDSESAGESSRARG